MQVSWGGLNQPKRRRLLYVLVVVACLIGLLVAYTVSREDSLAEDPVIGTAEEVRELSVRTKQLSDTPDASNPGKSTRAYIANLRAIQASCKRVSTYEQQSKSSNLSESGRSLMNQSRDLCADLAKLSGYSLAIYTATEPLLSSRTNTRRYESLPLLAKHIRQRHLSAVETAVSALKRLPSYGIDFPSSALAQTQALKKTIESSSKPTYLPALRNYQLGLLGESQRFWGPYASVASLTRSIESQLKGYCQLLDDAPSECKN